MAIALTTPLAEAVGDEFSPGGEFFLQVESVTAAADVRGLVIDLEAAVDAGGGFVPLYSWRLTEGAIKRFAGPPRARVRIRDNNPGNLVTIRRSE